MNKEIKHITFEVRRILLNGTSTMVSSFNNVPAAEKFKKKCLDNGISAYIYKIEW